MLKQGIIKTLFTLLYFSTYSIAQLAQPDSEQRYIDSINHLPYNQRISTKVDNIKTYLDLAAAAQRIHYSQGVADAYSNLALIYFYQAGRNDESIHYLFNAIQIYEDIGKQEAAANLYAMYGYGLRNQDIEKAGSFMRQGIAIAEKAKANFLLMGMYDNYGVIKESTAAYDSAQFFYQRALDMKRAAADTVGIPYSLNKLATLHIKLKNYRLAKQLLDEAYAIRTNIKDPIGIAENLHFYGALYEAEKNYPLAIQYYQQSLDSSQKAAYANLIQQNLESLYKIMDLTGNHPQALHYLKLHQTYKDSLNQQAMLEHRALLEVQFETAVKEKELLVKRAELAESQVTIQQKQQLLFIVLALLAITALIGYFIWKQQKIKNNQLIEANKLQIALATIETQKQLQHQRLKIARDLHDNIGAQLTFIISSIDNLQFAVNNTAPKLEQKLSDIRQFTQNTIIELRDTIWAMNQTDISLEALRLRIHNLINKAGSIVENIHFNFSIDDRIKNITLSSIEGMNIYRTIQEAINNAIKHAAANTIDIHVKAPDVPGNRLQLDIIDNGIGFDIHNINNSGNGLSNMQKRITEIQGSMHINSQPHQGTHIHILI